MRVLWIATKPPVPPVDGGRLVQKLTLEALASRGVEVCLLAPVFAGSDRPALERELAAFCEPHLVEVQRRSLARALPAALPGRLPLAIARHAHPTLARRARALAEARAASSRPFDLIHVEQLHALPQARGAAGTGLPVVLRAQNVESDLWRAAAGNLVGSGFSVRAIGARLEAWRLAKWEGRAVGEVSRVVSLTRPDADRLANLVDSRGEGAGVKGKIEVIPAPFPSVLPSEDRRLPGEPAVVLLGSAGWEPNVDAARFMVHEVWPRARKRLPDARLHIFGAAISDTSTQGEAAGREGQERGIVHHPPPEDSAEAFVPGSILAVPLRVASGVRMKILEAWARGVPVVASLQAASGLDAVDGRDLLVAPDASSFADALARLAGEPDLARDLVAAGRRRLAEHHRPTDVAARLEGLYRRLASSGPLKPVAEER